MLNEERQSRDQILLVRWVCTFSGRPHVSIWLIETSALDTAGSLHTNISSILLKIFPYLLLFIQSS